MSDRSPLPRTVRVLGWVSFFADISSEMAYPLVPLFVVGVLGASAGALGGIEGAAQLVVALLAAWAGWRSDGAPWRGRAARRVPWIRVGYGLPVLGKTLVALASSAGLVLLGRAIDRVGKGVRGGPRDALIGDAIDPAQRGRAFGFHRAMDTAGAFCGVVLAGAALWMLDRGGALAAAPADGAVAPELARAIRGVLLLAAASSLASFVLTLRLRERPAGADAPAAGATASGAENATADRGTAARLPRAFGLALVPLGLFALGNSSDAFLILRAADQGLSPLSVIAAYALFNAVHAATASPIGRLSDRVGRWRLLAAGWTVHVAVYLGFALASPWSAWLLLPLYGLCAAFTDGVGKALVVDLAPPTRRGAALGIFHLMNGLGVLVGSLAAGLLWDGVSPAAPFVLGAACGALALASLPAVRSAS